MYVQYYLVLCRERDDCTHDGRKNFRGVSLRRWVKMIYILCFVVKPNGENDFGRVPLTGAHYCGARTRIVRVHNTTWRVWWWWW